MNAIIKLAGVAFAVAGFLAGAPQVEAQVSFNAGLEINSPTQFYSPLAPYGSWVDIAPYGHCWRPLDVGPDWRPYANGYWEWTDCGWYWVSDEPWAWACYHYGSWVNDSPYGWLWVPGTEWAPAWVEWRDSPDYVGWAPCGPAGYTVAPSFFMFVDVHHFHDHLRPGMFIVNDQRILGRTRLINNLTRTTRDFDGERRRVVINQGPGVDVIQRATGTRFTPRPIREVVSHTPAPATVQRTRSGPVYDRPAQPVPRASAVNRQPTAAPAPAEGTTRRERVYTPPASTTGREVPRTYSQPVVPPGGTAAEPRQRTYAPPTVEPRQRNETPAVPNRGSSQAPMYTPKGTPSASPAPASRPAAPRQERPPANFQAVPPTGREVPRVYQQNPPPAAVPARPREEVPPRAVQPQVTPQPVAPTPPKEKDRREDHGHDQ